MDRKAVIFLLARVYVCIIITLSLIFSCMSVEKGPTTWNHYINDTTTENPLDLYYVTSKIPNWESSTAAVMIPQRKHPKR